MQNNVKALVIFVVCLAGMAGTAFFIKAVNHKACWFCSTSDYFHRSVEFACSKDEIKRRKALDYLTKAADDGHAPAALLLSELYAGTLPEQVKPEYPEAFQCLSDAIEPDGTQARKYLDRASELFDAVGENAEGVEPDLAFRLAVMYLSPPWSEHDDVSSGRAAEVGLKLLNAAAVGGNIDAMFKLAAMEENRGRIDEAVKWYSRASEKRPDYKLSLRIGDIYLYGKGVAVDNKKAVEWYKKAEAQAQATKDISPEEREHMLDIPAVRIEIAGRKMKRAGGKNPVVVNYILAGNGVHYIVRVRDDKAEGLVTAGEVIRTDDNKIKAVAAPAVRQAEGTSKEKAGFESMNQGMEWVLSQWVISKYGEPREFIYRPVK